MAMAMQQYDAGRIAQWSTSRASLEANGCRHRVSARIASPRRLPWSTISNKNTQNTNKTQRLASNYSTFQALVISENFMPQNGPSTQLIDATSFV
jgi:hypothetical protein